MKSLRISHKLLLIFGLPFAGAVYLGASAALDSYRTLSRYARIHSSAQVVRGIGVAVHELQRERGRSSTFLSSRGTKFGTELAAQREATDKALGSLRTATSDFDASRLSSEFAQEFSATLEKLNALGAKREAISALQIAPPVSLAYYSGLIAELLSVNAGLVRFVDDAAVANGMAGYVSFVQFKEQCGIERALLSGVFAAGKFTPESYAKLLRNGAAQDTYLAVFRIQATAEQRRDAEALSQAQEFKAVEGLRAMALERGGSGSFEVDPADWFNKSTARIDRLKQFEDRLADDYRLLIASKSQAAKRRFTMIIGLVGGVLTAAAILGFMVSRRLIQALVSVKDGLVAIARGDLRDRELVRSQDETGEMMVALGETIRGVRSAVGSAEIHWETIAAQREEVARLAIVVENAPTSILVAGADLVAVYANPAAEKAFQRIRPHLGGAGMNLRGLPATLLIPETHELRAKLAQPSELPCTAQFRIGPETITATASPIIDAEGRYLGPVLLWEIITERMAAAEAEKESLVRMQQLVAQLNQNSQTLAAAAEELSATSKTMQEATHETSQFAATAAGNAGNVGQSISSVAAGAEEMSAAVSEIAKATHEVTKVSGEAVDAAHAASTTVNRLNETSNQIGQVVRIIGGLADQTNLLALNATIEAARVGEAGKGFAVVANEVKGLAQQSAKASEEVSSRIAAMQSEAKAAAVAIQGIVDVIGKISQLQTSVASSVEEQTATTNEIARSAAGAAQGAHEITDAVHNVAGAASRSKEGAGAILTAAEELARMAGSLRQLAYQAHT